MNAHQALDVLIVEGDEDLASFFRTMLQRRFGRVPQCVPSLEAAIACLAVAPKNALIVDVDSVALPVGEVTRRARAACADLLIVLIGSGLQGRRPPPGATLMEKPVALAELWRALEAREPANGAPR